jgi:hypothetical protein
MLYQQLANIGMPFKHRVAGSSPARLTTTTFKINQPPLR